MRARFGCAAAGLGVISAGLAVIAVPASSAAGRHATTSGTIQVYVTSANDKAPVDLVTGAIVDHGSDHQTGPGGNFEKIVLSKGTFELDATQFNKSFKGKTDPLGCTATQTGVGTALAISDGTGAYQGITGTVTVKAVYVGIFPRKSGKCAFSGNPISSNFIITGSGHVSY